jgi:hypothetical protein
MMEELRVRNLSEITSTGSLCPPGIQPSNLNCPTVPAKRQELTWTNYRCSLKPRSRSAGQSLIVVKYVGTNRCNDVISALFPTFASS